MKPGSGDGFLVWDKNGNGLIDDNTEMMSEFDVDGNKRFQNGFEKLAFYFDKDNNGVIEGKELKQLKVWVDIDGDAQTDKGELQPLPKHGITEIVIPGHHELVSTTKTENWAADSTNTSAEKVSLRKATGVDNPLAGGHPTLEGLPTQQLLSTQESLYDRGSAGAKIRSQVRVGINIYEEKGFRDALDQIHLGVVEQLTRETFDEIIAGVVPLVNGQLDLDIGATQDRAKALLTERIWMSSMVANFDTAQIVAIEGWRPENVDFETYGKAFEVFFQNANEQTSQELENVAPSINSITLNPDKPKAGDAVAASVTGSDPEGLALGWHWNWSGPGVNQAGGGGGNAMSMSLGTSESSNPGDVYTLSVTLTDEIGASASATKSISGIKANEPPVITSASMTGRMEPWQTGSLNAKGKDPDGPNSELMWDISGVASGGGSGPTTSTTFRPSSQGRFTAHIGLTDADGDRVATTRTVWVERQSSGGSNGDPLIFDLNGDGKVEVQGAEAGSPHSVYLPPGIWDIVVDSLDSDAEFLISDANMLNGSHRSTQSGLNAAGRWALTLRLQGQDQVATINMSSATQGKISANGVSLTVNQTSDGGYEHDGTGVVSGGGRECSSILIPSAPPGNSCQRRFRPGLNAPAAPGGAAVYDGKVQENIGSKWRENPDKGNTAKIYTASGEWIGEWINGDKSLYYYGKREDRERTQWMAGNGDGLLVWDHNGNGIIDDNTEMMSEYTTDGKKAFANGFENSHTISTKTKMGSSKATSSMG